MDKYFYIEAAMTVLRSLTKEEFQKKVNFVLTKYYDSIGVQYQTFSSSGGDKKNDGWVPQGAIFYQFYAPIPKESLKRDIYKKFKEDLEGLIYHINGKKWNGIIKEFIFIVQTFDDGLPENSDDRYNKIVEGIKQKYGINFKYKLDNLDYIEKILESINEIDTLKKICTKLKVDTFYYIDMVEEKLITETILKISGEMNNNYANDQIKNNYKRISSNEKIIINSLSEVSDKINAIILKLDVVEDAIHLMNQELNGSNKFECLKNKLFKIYTEESNKNKGADLYKIIIKRLSSVFDESESFFNIATEFLVVYVFDRCDIFEKE